MRWINKTNWYVVYKLNCASFFVEMSVKILLSCILSKILHIEYSSAHHMTLSQSYY